MEPDIEGRALQEQEPEDGDRERLHRQQEDQVADHLREEDHRTIHRREQERFKAALILLVHERPIEPEHRGEDECQPQQPGRDVARVEVRARLRQRHEVHHHREQRVQAHRHDHLLGAKLHDDVLLDHGAELAP